MTIRNIYLGTSIAFASFGILPSAAQLHESISVEGKYVPEIIKVDRINTFPKPLKFSMAASPLEYEKSGVAAAFIPSMLAMPATGWNDTKEFSSNRGYLELGAGSWLNSTLSAGYRFVDNASTLAGIRLQHNSTSLWKPHMSDATDDVTRYRYDESVGLYISHVFKGYGRLDASLDYHVGMFNYYGYCPINPIADTKIDAPTQTLNDFAMRIDWRSPMSNASTLSYGASARVRHFAFRSLPLPYAWDKEHSKGNRETDIEIAAGVRMPWDGGSSIGLDADLNVLTYGGEQDLFNYSKGPGETEISLHRPDNYGMLVLTPYYRFNRGMLDIRLGADIDLTFNAGPDGNRYSFFHIAPDVNFALQSGQFGMYLNLVGGSQLNTLANLYQNDYYMSPAITSTRPTYTPLDATLGINIGPFSGFSIGVEGRFMASKNVHLGGWYQAWINNGDKAFSGMYDQSGDLSKRAMMYSLDSEGINLHGFGISGVIEYTPSSVFSFKAKATVQQQDWKKGIFNGYDRPKVTADISAAVRPVSQLKVSAGFNYRAKRAIYTRSFVPLSAGIIPDSDSENLCRLSLPDISLLNLAASWNFTDSFSVWLQADNILNRHDDMLPMLPAQGISVGGGLKVLL